MSKGHVEMDCTKRCRSRNHGQTLTSAITKRSVTDEALASFIRWTCSNFTQAFDNEGRTAIHMAASRGRRHLMEWLIRNSTEAFVNAKDRESGYTPLHRSIFYGQIHIAVALMKIGVNLDIVDKDDFKALDHAVLDRQYMYKKINNTQPCDVYVWGTNSNYTLGTGVQHHKKTPDVLRSFRRNTSVKQVLSQAQHKHQKFGYWNGPPSNFRVVCLGKFHSVWICSTELNEGEVWACGQVGAHYGTVIKPVLLDVPEPCVQAAITLTSTVLLLQSGLVIEYSLNCKEAELMLNRKAENCSLRKNIPFKRNIMKLSSSIGASISTSRVHAILWNADRMYTWGENLGQMSLPFSEKYIPYPSKVTLPKNKHGETLLHLADASDYATVFSSTRGDVYLLLKHSMRRIVVSILNLKQVSVYSMSVDDIKVLLLTNVGQLHIWQSNTNKLTRCVFGLSHQKVITHVAQTDDAIYITTNYGDAYLGKVSEKKSAPLTPQLKKKEKENENNSSVKEFLEKDDCTSVRIKRMPNVHRSVSITISNDGMNFACLQIKPTCGVTSFPKISPRSLPKHMRMLMETASPDDILTDVVFKVNTRLYAAHMYVIASGSELLYKMYQENKLMSKDETPILTIENILPEVFERILTYFYTGACDVSEIGPCDLKIKREDFVKTPNKANEITDNNPDVILENPMEITAYAVYKNQNNKVKKQKGRQMKKHQQTVQPVRIYCDPIRLVQQAAKLLQVTELCNKLDAFFYKDCHIYKKASVDIESQPKVWNIMEFPELQDTNVLSKDGVMIPAHKCILAARLEYFHSMFIHSWSESKMMATVSLPINYSILSLIINFLYTDSCPEVESSESLDFLCNVLVIADQLFIIRLKEICEVALGNMINFRTCSELYKFADTYNALQLKQCCMEFIVLNIGNFLENRNLDSLDDDLLEELTNCYCNFNPIMSSRVITPFCNAPEDNIIDELNKTNPVDLDICIVNESVNTNEVKKKKNKISKKIEYTDSEKARMRYESVSSVNSLDLTNDKNGDITLSLSNISQSAVKQRDNNKWVKVQSPQDKQQTSLQARLKAISIAKDILNEPQNDMFTKLTKANTFVASSSPESGISNTTRMSISPKEYSFSEYMKSPQGSLVINYVGPKLSQKQRKKLALQGETVPQHQEDLSNKRDVNSPKNPWKKIEPLQTANSPCNKPKSLEFNQILADQKKLKDDSSRIMSKPLHLTQLEDKAIEELERFYNVQEIDDELITVHRIELQLSSPQWNHFTPK